MNYQLKTWMHDLAYNLKIEGFKNRPLCQIALPGTHDSGTYGIPLDILSMMLTPDAEKAVAVAFVTFRYKVYSWAVSQKMDITNQLNSGVRYLDLRVTGAVIPVVPSVISSKLDEPCICHSLKSVEVKDVIEQVASFLTENNREVVILDFQHFHKMDEEQHKKIIGYLRNKLEKMMVNPQKHGPNVTLNDLEQDFEKKGRCIIIYNNSETANDNKDILWQRSDSTINSPWANTDSYRGLIHYLIKNTFTKFPSNDCFMVVQGILNPQNLDYVTGDLMNYSGPTGNLVSQFQYRGKKPNIVMIDDFTENQARKIIANNIYPDTLYFTLGETSDNGPALLKCGTQLYMIWRATNKDHIVYAESSDGVIWSDSYMVTTKFQTTKESPAACEFKGNIYVAWKTTDDKGSVCVAPINGDGTKNWVVKCNGSGMTTKSRPAVVSYKDKLYVFWRATNENHLVYAYTTDGENWHGSYKAGPNFNTSESGPSVAVYKEQLIMVWRATNENHIVYATYDDSSKWSESKRVCKDFQTTHSAPTILGASDGYLYVAWRATSSNQTLMYARYNDNWSSPSPVKHLDQTNESTDAGPSLADDGKQVLVAWKRKDNDCLNVGTLETK